MLKEFISNKKFLLFLILFVFCLISSYLIFTTSQNINTDRHLVLLASQFLTKHIALLPNQDLPLGDVSDYFANYYLYFGPFASIVLMPFVFVFGKTFDQTTLGIISMIVSFITIFLISKKFKFSSTDSLWLCLFFVFSTVIFSTGLINISAYQVEVLGVPLILLALYEYLNKKRGFFIGILLALAVLTRVVLVLAVIFFLLEFFNKRLSGKQILLIILPVIFSLIIFGLYNQRRFHSFFESGIKYSISAKSFPLSMNLEHGYNSLAHIPANLYTFFIMPPEPLLEKNQGFVLKFPYLRANPWGMAIWFTSPLLLTLIYKFRKSKYTTSLLLTIFAIAIPLFTFYSIGFSQFGYRYALDFLPFLFLLLIPSFSGKLNRKDLFLISIGVIFNCIYITSLWNIYPLFGIR